MRDERGNWQDFLSLDEKVVSDFVMTSASVVKPHGQFAPKIFDELQIHLNPSSSLLRLYEQKNDFLSYLLFLYGEDAFYENLFRFSIRPVIFSLQNNLRLFLKSLSHKADLVFGRPFTLRSEHPFPSPSAISLLNQSLLDLMESLDEAATKIDLCLKQQLALRPIQTGSAERDTLLAAALEFTQGVEVKDQVFYHRSLFKIELSQHLAGLTARVHQWMKLIKPHLSTSPGKVSLESSMGWIASEVGKLRGLSSSEVPFACGALPAEEARREAFIFSLYSLDQLLVEFTQLVLDAIQIKPQESFSTYEVPKQLLDSLTCFLIEKGLLISDACSIVHKLRDYCVGHQVRAEDLLPMELAKVAPLSAAHGEKLIEMCKSYLKEFRHLHAAKEISFHRRKKFVEYPSTTL